MVVVILIIIQFLYRYFPERSIMYISLRCIHVSNWVIEKVSRNGCGRERVNELGYVRNIMDNR